MINVLLYLFSVFSPHKLIIESMSRVKFRVPVKIDILVVYKVSFLFELLDSWQTQNLWSVLHRVSSAEIFCCGELMLDALSSTVVSALWAFAFVQTHSPNFSSAKHGSSSAMTNELCSLAVLNTCWKWPKPRYSSVLQDKLGQPFTQLRVQFVSCWGSWGMLFYKDIFCAKGNLGCVCKWLPQTEGTDKRYKKKKSVSKMQIWDWACCSMIKKWNSCQRLC